MLRSLSLDRNIMIIGDLNRDLFQEYQDQEALITLVKKNLPFLGFLLFIFGTRSRDRSYSAVTMGVWF